MGISKIQRTYGLLDVWREIMREDIYHYNQIGGVGAPYVGGCKVYTQPEREQIGRALVQAVKRFETYLHYSPVQYWTDEVIPLRVGVPYELQELNTKLGKVIAFGQRATTLIDDDIAVSYTDSDSDNILDTATMTVTVAAGTAADEIQIFFRSNDGAPSDGHELWRIEPVTVSVSGTTATITGHRANFVNPAIWAQPYDLSANVNLTEKNAGDTQQSGDFVEYVDVYRVYNDTTVQAQLLSDPILSQTTSLNTLLTDTVLALPIDSELGGFRIRLDCCGTVCRYPQWVKVYYKHGLALDFDHINYEFAEMLVRLANTYVPITLPCELCDRTRDLWVRDREPVPAELLSANSVGNRFGLMRGQLEAWRFVMDNAIGQGGKLTRSRGFAW